MLNIFMIPIFFLDQNSLPREGTRQSRTKAGESRNPKREVKMSRKILTSLYDSSSAFIISDKKKVDETCADDELPECDSMSDASEGECGTQDNDGYGECSEYSFLLDFEDDFDLLNERIAAIFSEDRSRTEPSARIFRRILGSFEEFYGPD